MKPSHRTSVAAVALSAAALLGGGVAYAVNQSVDSPSANTSETTMMSGPGMGMGSFDRARPFDAQFIDQMIVHHQGAIMSTQAMIADSERPELRTLAQDIITSQREQITQMRNWRAQWYPDLEPTFGGMGGSMMGGSGDDKPTGGSMMGGSMMGGSGDDEPMGGSMMGGSAGTERMYLQMMIVHHQLGVDMAEQAKQKADHSKLADLAAVIAEEQAAQILQMRGYLAASPEPAAG
ncbi:MAG: DUF305 domain-containing protein [Ornithinimicrobium sp.]|uniref:DUF305 domain-containing protein n=1 Tax=Ornithinimicrobium sp. TaxID=1977084 RepID=UPI003D9AE21D